MPSLSESKLLERDAKRDLDAELRESLREMKRGEVGRVMVPNKDGKYVESLVARVRIKVGVSQSRFAEMLGVSKRTLQEWEQGRREPSGAAKSLLKIAERRPDVLREIFC